MEAGINFDYRHRTRLSVIALTMWIALVSIGCKKEAETSRAIESSRSGDKIVAKAPSSNAKNDETRDRLIIEKMRSDEWRTAEELTRKWLIATPDHVMANERMVSIYLHNGRWQEAIEIMERIAILDPSRNEKLHMAIASIEYENGQPLAAIERLKTLSQGTLISDDRYRQLSLYLGLQGFRFDSNELIRDMMRRGGASEP